MRRCRVLSVCVEGGGLLSVVSFIGRVGGRWERMGKTESHTGFSGSLRHVVFPNPRSDTSQARVMEKKRMKN